MTERQASIGHIASLVMLGIGVALLGFAAMTITGGSWGELESMAWTLMWSGLCLAISAWLLESSQATGKRALGWIVFAVGVVLVAINLLKSLTVLIPTPLIVSDSTVWLMEIVSMATVLAGVIVLLPVVGAKNRIIAWCAALIIFLWGLLYVTRELFPSWDLLYIAWDVSVVSLGVVGLGLLWLAGSLFKRAKYKLRDHESSLPTRVRLDVACPRCGGRHGLTPGESTCPACRLRFRLEVEEQRCACGYLLVGLAAETCPECGREIPESLRWRNGEEDSDSAETNPESSRVSPQSPQDDRA